VDLASWKALGCVSASFRNLAACRTSLTHQMRFLSPMRLSAPSWETLPTHPAPHQTRLRSSRRRTCFGSRMEASLHPRCILCIPVTRRMLLDDCEDTRRHAARSAPSGRDEHARAGPRLVRPSKHRQHGAILMQRSLRSRSSIWVFSPSCSR
jgi:hypothetical protein